MQPGERSPLAERAGPPPGTPPAPRAASSASDSAPSGLGSGGAEQSGAGLASPVTSLPKILPALSACLREAAVRLSVSFRPLLERAHCRPGTEPGTEEERRDLEEEAGSGGSGETRTPAGDKHEIQPSALLAASPAGAGPRHQVSPGA